MIKNNKKGLRVLFGAVLLQLCLGAIYSWSLFNQPLIDKYGWGKEQVLFTYSLAIFIFALSTVVSGRLVDRYGPKRIAMIGGIVYGVGMMLSSIATSLTMLYLSYGVLAGLGVGFAYVCPLSTCLKWFPDKKGLITGITVGAFGAGSMVFKSVIVGLLNGVGVSQTFFYLGLIYMGLVVLGAQFLKLPPLSKLEVVQDMDLRTDRDLTVKEMIKTPSFYFVWTMFLLGTMPGLLVIGLAKDIGIEMVSLEAVVAAQAVVFIALFNAGGRLIWGMLSDKFGRLPVISSMFIVSIVCLLYMSMIPMSLLSFYICLFGVASCFGGFLSVFPTLTSELYGMKNLGANYGVIFQAYGIAALIGPLIKGGASGFNQTFLIASGFAFLGGLLALKLWHSNRKKSTKANLITTN